jgi:hypothetical protein
MSIHVEVKVWRVVVEGVSEGLSHLRPMNPVWLSPLPVVLAGPSSPLGLIFRPVEVI